MKPDIDRHIDDILETAGLYKTRGRAAIMKALLKAPSPLTREQIASQLGKKHLNKVSIYRALESFLQAGLVHKAFLHNRTWHFEPAYRCTDTQCHPHFTCTSCGATQCLPELSVPIVKGLKKGFLLKRQRVQLEGLCPDCRSSQS